MKTFHIVMYSILGFFALCCLIYFEHNLRMQRIKHLTTGDNKVWVYVKLKRI